MHTIYGGHRKAVEDETFLAVKSIQIPVRIPSHNPVRSLESIELRTACTPDRKIARPEPEPARRRRSRPDCRRCPRGTCRSRATCCCSRRGRARPLPGPKGPTRSPRQPAPMWDPSSTERCDEHDSAWSRQHVGRDHVGPCEVRDLPLCSGSALRKPLERVRVPAAGDERIVRQDD